MAVKSGMQQSVACNERVVPKSTRCVAHGVLRHMIMLSSDSVVMLIWTPASAHLETTEQTEV